MSWMIVAAIWVVGWLATLAIFAWLDFPEDDSIIISAMWPIFLPAVLFLGLCQIIWKEIHSRR